MHYDPLSKNQQLPHDTLSPEVTWSKLSQVAVNGAEYDSRERQPHPKCLDGTRVVLLNHIYGLLDNRKESKIIWLHGTAGVGKSAIAFTVAEKMREQVASECRLAGTFFFSRQYAKRSTTDHFFPTLAYQLASNFPSIREDVHRAICEDPTLLDSDKSLREQMKALFLQPLSNLQRRLRDCPPLGFVLDALDECTSTIELADLISLLGQAIRQSDLPVIHIIFTSRSDPQIRSAFNTEVVHPLVCEIPVKTSREGPAAIIPLDGADVDSDICIFLEHSFKELQSRHPNFMLPTSDEMVLLASRAGRRFIVASTMMKFIDDGYNDPRDRLQFMLALTNQLLPGTEMYRLYDIILSTCADPKQAYFHLSVVATLVYPLPISQISELLGLGQGRGVETVLMPLRSLIDIPSDSSLPVNIYHSSIYDYASNPSNCSLPEVRHLVSPHSLLACSSLSLMIRDVTANTGLLDALSELKKQGQVIQRHDPQSLTYSSALISQSLEPLQVLLSFLWLRGDRSSDLRFWLESLDGRAWLHTQEGKDWVKTHGGNSWLQTQGGLEWLQTQGGLNWLQTQGGRHWLQTQGGQHWLPTHAGREWLQIQDGREWLLTQHGREWLHTLCGREWLQAPGGREWLQTQGGRAWLQTQGGREWLQTAMGQDWLQTLPGREWMETQGGRMWMQTKEGQDWLLTRSGREWMQTWSGREWMQTRSGKEWMQTRSGSDWLQTLPGRMWLQTQGRPTQLQTQARQMWLQTQHVEEFWLNQCSDVAWKDEQEWPGSLGGREWSEDEKSWLLTKDERNWRSTPATSFSVAMEEFSNTLEVMGKYVVAEGLPLQPACQAIQLFKTLPDFLTFPVFLALRPQNHSTSALSQGHLLPDVEIIRAMKGFVAFAQEAMERSRSTSDALAYACQNWAFHLSRAPNPWDKALIDAYVMFINIHLLSWLERQWCLMGLRSCLVVLSEWQKIAKEHPQHPPGPETEYLRFPVHDRLIRHLSGPETVRSLNETYQCLWLGEYGLQCSDLFCGYNLSTHLHEVHGIHGADMIHVRCRWNGCGLELNRYNLSSHVTETHLRITGARKKGFTRKRKPGSGL